MLWMAEAKTKPPSGRFWNATRKRMPRAKAHTHTRPPRHLIRLRGWKTISGQSMARGPTARRCADWPVGYAARAHVHLGSLGVCWVCAFVWGSFVVWLNSWIVCTLFALCRRVCGWWLDGRCLWRVRCGNGVWPEQVRWGAVTWSCMACWVVRFCWDLLFCLRW